MSRYQDIANDIEKDIIEKKYTRKLPEQFELAQKYQTSRVTIVHALKILQSKILIWHKTKKRPPLFFACLPAIQKHRPCWGGALNSVLSICKDQIILR